jgi:hypothetical protein
MTGGPVSGPSEEQQPAGQEPAGSHSLEQRPTERRPGAQQEPLRPE